MAENNNEMLFRTLQISSKTRNFRVGGNAESKRLPVVSSSRAISFGSDGTAPSRDREYHSTRSCRRDDGNAGGGSTDAD